MGDEEHTLESLKDQLRRFAADRDWNQFHSPKNLAAALSVEAAELLEPFQWLTEEQSRNLSPEQREAVRKEIADVLIYLIRLADKLDIDLLQARATRSWRTRRSTRWRRPGGRCASTRTSSWSRIPGPR